LSQIFRFRTHNEPIYTFSYFFFFLESCCIYQMRVLIRSLGYKEFLTLTLPKANLQLKSRMLIGCDFLLIAVFQI
jgi:hypothetical protein